MLVIGSKALDAPVLSLHVGGEIARTSEVVIDPDGLKVAAYTLTGPAIGNGEYGDILEETSFQFG